MSKIGERLNINRCPQADYDGYSCYRCKVKNVFEEYIDCPHNLVNKRGEKWWLKKREEE